MSLRPGDVHVWSIGLDLPTPRLSILRQTLSSDELERASRFHFERDRDRFVAARGSMRGILAEYLGVAPASLAFAYGPRGKPALESGSGQLELGFNLSHSDAFGLVALTLGRPIGVDLERVRPFEDVSCVPRKIFSARELAQFQQLAPSEHQAAFFKAWTRKEAFVKATGQGFNTDVAEVEVTFAPDEGARLVSVVGDTPAASTWSLRDLVTQPEYAGALAVPGSIAHLVCLNWQSDLTLGDAQAT